MTDDLSVQGFRPLGIASHPEREDQLKVDLADERDLTFAGFAEFLAPPQGVGEGGLGRAFDDFMWYMATIVVAINEEGRRSILYFQQCSP